MKTYGGVDLWIHVFLNSALVEDEWSASRPGRLTPEETAPGTHWIGGWVGLRADLYDVTNRKFLTLPGLELQTLGHPARSQSLYRLRYPGCNRLLVVLTSRPLCLRFHILKKETHSTMISF
jgi:hypothetical protein